jgi:hypothetical protein
MEQQTQVFPEIYLLETHTYILSLAHSPDIEILSSKRDLVLTPFHLMFTISSIECKEVAPPAVVLQPLAPMHL